VRQAARVVGEALLAGSLVLGLPGEPLLAAPRARPATGPLADAVRQGIATGTQDFEHRGWNLLVSTLVSEQGRVDYEGFSVRRHELDWYLASLDQAPIASLHREALLALLINAYNACTVRLILDGVGEGRLPRSIRELRDPWGRRSCRVGGETVSLDTIEHGLIRPFFKDPRIHAAVNCASRGCPRLAAQAYRGEAIDAQLQRAMQDMVNDPGQLRIEGRQLRVSRIFDWYAEDFLDPTFLGSRASILDYIRAFAKPPLRRAIDALGPSPRLGYLDYDWNLNSR
jgi:hypothetical protein